MSSYIATIVDMSYKCLSKWKTAHSPTSTGVTIAIAGVPFGRAPMEQKLQRLTALDRVAKCWTSVKLSLLQKVQCLSLGPLIAALTSLLRTTFVQARFQHSCWVPQ
jgi:hypothetical protein